MQLPRISREQIESIKSRIDFAALAAERGLTLHRKGRQLYALCPFHREKTPSFAMNLERGLFHCFGCGVSGDIVGFVMRFDGVSFPEALQMLAARAGVALVEPSAVAVRPEDLCGRTEPWR
jgi:DNA primase